MTITIGFLIFPNVQLLDLTGPYEIFATLPDRNIHLIWKNLDPITTSSGLQIIPTTLLENCPSQLEVLCVPGGGTGVNMLLTDDDVIRFLKEKAATSRFVTSVCTGALLLGAAGILTGKRATTHWASQHLLPLVGAIPVNERIVQDGNIITGGGVTAGIDFALKVVAEVTGKQQDAECIQLHLQYAPEPPFSSGSPDTASEEVIKRVQARMSTNIKNREEIIKKLTQPK